MNDCHKATGDKRLIGLRRKLSQLKINTIKISKTILLTFPISIVIGSNHTVVCTVGTVNI